MRTVIAILRRCEERGDVKREVVMLVKVVAKVGDIIHYATNPCWFVSYAIRHLLPNVPHSQRNNLISTTVNVKAQAVKMVKPLFANMVWAANL